MILKFWDYNYSLNEIINDPFPIYPNYEFLFCMTIMVWIEYVIEKLDILLNDSDELNLSS